MAAPFVYVPDASASTPSSCFAPPQLNPAPVIIPLSPAVGLSSLCCVHCSEGSTSPGAPVAFNSNSARWQSWYTMSSLSLPPVSPDVLPTRSASIASGSQRRNSRRRDEQGASPSPSLHIWLIRPALSPAFHFDLAPSVFAPPLHVGPASRRRTILSDAELSQPATQPALRTLRILHPTTPFWPIDIRGVHAPYSELTIGDVLRELHHSLHQRITRADWETLNNGDAERVREAFTRRCRGEAVHRGVPPALLRDYEVAASNGGVKRVDFLLGKTVFGGLERAHEDPEGCFRLVTV